MKLHANAALSLTQRRRMVQRVLEQGVRTLVADQVQARIQQALAALVHTLKSGRSAALRLIEWEPTSG